MKKRGERGRERNLFVKECRAAGVQKEQRTVWFSCSDSTGCRTGRCIFYDVYKYMLLTTSAVKVSVAVTTVPPTITVSIMLARGVAVDESAARMAPPLATRPRTEYTAEYIFYYL